MVVRIHMRTPIVNNTLPHWLLLSLSWLLSCSTKQSPVSITAYNKSVTLTQNAEKRYWDNKTLASFNRVSNYADERHSFTLAKAMPVHIHTVGEIINIDSNTVWNCDAVEIYLDLRNDKQPGFNSKDDDRQYIMGKNNKIQGIEFKLTDQRRSRYMLEVKIPWQILKINPTTHLTIGFDFAIIDNDGNEKGAENALGKLAWHAADGDIYINTSLWGNLVLLPSEATKVSDSATVYTSFTKTAPLIDGEMDEIWKEVPATNTCHVLYGPIASASDASASLKTVWDQDNLYFLVQVTDDTKTYQTYTRCDYGWIEDLTGTRIWQMTLENSKHAGGALKNRSADTTIQLPKGTYVVRYLSDESHAYKMWDDDAPATSFYGIVVKK